MGILSSLRRVSAPAPTVRSNCLPDHGCGRTARLPNPIGTRFDSNSCGLELGHHSIEVIHSEIDHPLLLRPAEIVGLLFERCKDRAASFLLPDALVEVVYTEMFGVPGGEGCGIARPKEQPANAGHFGHGGSPSKARSDTRADYPRSVMMAEPSVFIEEDADKHARRLERKSRRTCIRRPLNRTLFSRSIRASVVRHIVVHLDGARYNVGLGLFGRSLHFRGHQSPVVLVHGIADAVFL